MSDSDDGEKVGPGHPPRKHRFQKGKSGNPRGRPKGSLTSKLLDDYYFDAFLEREVSINGRNGPERANAVIAMMMLWRQKALNGDTNAIEKILDRLERRAAAAPSPGLTLTPDRSEDDEAILRRYLRPASKLTPEVERPDDETRSDEEGDDG
jgi:hypothetical protein